MESMPEYRVIRLAVKVAEFEEKIDKILSELDILEESLKKRAKVQHYPILMRGKILYHKPCTLHLDVNDVRKAIAMYREKVEEIASPRCK